MKPFTQFTVFVLDNNKPDGEKWTEARTFLTYASAKRLACEFAADGKQTDIVESLR